MRGFVARGFRGAGGSVLLIGYAFPMDGGGFVVGFEGVGLLTQYAVWELWFGVGTRKRPTISGAFSPQPASESSKNAPRHDTCGECNSHGTGPCPRAPYKHSVNCTPVTGLVESHLRVQIAGAFFFERGENTILY